MKTVTPEQFKEFGPCWLETAAGRKRCARVAAAAARVAAAAARVAAAAARVAAREHEVKLLKELLREVEQ